MDARRRRVAVGVAAATAGVGAFGSLLFAPLLADLDVGSRVLLLLTSTAMLTCVAILICLSAFARNRDAGPVPRGVVTPDMEQEIKAARQQRRRPGFTEPQRQFMREHAEYARDVAPPQILLQLTGVPLLVFVAVTAGVLGSTPSMWITSAILVAHIILASYFVILLGRTTQLVPIATADPRRASGPPKEP